MLINGTCLAEIELIKMTCFNCKTYMKDKLGLHKNSISCLQGIWIPTLQHLLFGQNERVVTKMYMKNVSLSLASKLRLISLENFASATDGI